MDLITSTDLAEITGKSPATIRKYAPSIPGAQKHGKTWIFTDRAAAVEWVYKNVGDKPGRPANKK